MSSGLVEIGSGAFYDCSSLSKITIPNAVQNLKAASYGKNKVILTWNVSGGADGYLVYGQKNGKYGYVGMTTTGTRFVDTKALDTVYNFYWVFPYVTETDGDMRVGGTPQYVFEKGVIPAVTNLKASSVSGAVKLKKHPRHSIHIIGHTHIIKMQMER